MEKICPELSCFRMFPKYFGSSADELPELQLSPRPSAFEFCDPALRRRDLVATCPAYTSDPFASNLQTATVEARRGVPPKETAASEALVEESAKSRVWAKAKGKAVERGEEGRGDTSENRAGRGTQQRAPSLSRRTRKRRRKSKRQTWCSTPSRDQSPQTGQ